MDNEIPNPQTNPYSKSVILGQYKQGRFIPGQVRSVITDRHHHGVAYFIILIAPILGFLAFVFSHLK